MVRFAALSLSFLVAVTISACDAAPTNLESSPPSDLEASHGSTDGPRSVTVQLKEINDSGITGQATIVDDGATIVVSGTAEGMRPNASFEYLSLFYDKASPPRGPDACQPGVFDPNHPLFLTAEEMAGGIWTVDSDGDGSLLDSGAADGAEYVSVDMIGTISIRDLTVNAGVGPEAVVACGKVTHGPAR